MKGLLEQAVIVGCDVDGCAKLLIFNRGIDRQDLDEAILRNGWQPIKSPIGDTELQQEHACPAHVERIVTEAIDDIVKGWDHILEVWDEANEAKA